jgi:carboxylesterase type B
MAPKNSSSEDCLTLNIMKPASPSSDPAGYPVMFFIHGGAFIVGSSADMTHTEISDRLVSRGVIVVTINYRLGPFGFFTDSEAPGNYGLWDQVEALKFNAKIISSFNGNPKNVTIFGASAGAASVSWLTLSPATKGLFARAITMGGSAFCPWAHFEDDVLEFSKKLAKALNCSGTSSKEVKECLKGKTTKEIEEATSTFVKGAVRGDGVNFCYFCPRLDNDFVKGSTMSEVVKNAPKTVNFLGMCSQEYIAFALKNPFTDPTAKHLPISHKKAANFGRQDFVEIVETFIANEKVASDRIIEFYETQKQNYSKNEYLQIFCQLFSDLTFNIPAMREALQKAENGSEVYFFVYDFASEELVAKLKMDMFEGAGHGADFSNIFGSFLGFPSPDWNDPKVSKVQKIYADLFVNFAKNGVPSSDGLTVAKVTSNSKLPYIEINVDSKLKENLWPERLQFWDKMAKDFGYDWPEMQYSTNSANKL